MTATPGMMLWTDRYLADTGHLTTLQHGAYLLILMAMWRSSDGWLPGDDKRLSRCARMAMDKWRHVGSEVRELFITDAGGRVSQKTLQEQLAVALCKKEKSRLAALIRHHGKPLKTNDACDADAPFEQTPSNATNTNTYIKKEASKKESKSTPLYSPSDFEEFWGAYPRRGGSNPKAPAEGAFRGKIGKGVEPSSIIDGARHYAEGIRADGKERTAYVAQAVTWLNQERWNDEYIPEKRLGRNGKQNLTDTATELQRKWFGRTDEAHNGTGAIAGQAPVILLPIRGGAGPGDVRNGHSFDAEPVRGPSDPAGDGPVEGDAGDVQLPAIGGGRSG